MRRRAPSDAELAVATGVPLLQPFDQAQLAALLGPGALAVYDDDAPMFSAGDPADRFFVLIAGAIRLYKFSISYLTVLFAAVALDALVMIRIS